MAQTETAWDHCGPQLHKCQLQGILELRGADSALHIVPTSLPPCRVLKPLVQIFAFFKLESETRLRAGFIFNSEHYFTPNVWLISDKRAEGHEADLNVIICLQVLRNNCSL